MPDTSADMMFNLDRTIPYTPMYSNTTAMYNTSTRNDSDDNSESDLYSVHDIKYNVNIRVICLLIIIVLGLIGGILVFIWMWFNRRKRSRVNILILNLALADISVILLATIPQVIWEFNDRYWTLGNAMCKIFKFFMGLSLASSSYMLVIIGVDRHWAIRAPLREPWPAMVLAAIGWGVSAAIAFPNFFVFHFNVVENVPKCENIFRDLPKRHRQAWIMYALVTTFVIPLFILLICYARIFMKVAQKAAMGKVSKRHSFKPGKVHLQSTPSTSLPKAKIKTLKITVVIVAAFILFGLPYFIAEMIMSFGDHRIMNMNVYAFLGAVAPANSAMNPYIFLLFNANWRCFRGIQACCCKNTVADRRGYVYSSASVRSEMTSVTNGEYVRSSNKTEAIVDKNSVEMNRM